MTWLIREPKGKSEREGKERQKIERKERSEGERKRLGEVHEYLAEEGKGWWLWFGTQRRHTMKKAIKQTIVCFSGFLFFKNFFYSRLRFLGRKICMVGILRIKIIFVVLV